MLQWECRKGAKLVRKILKLSLESSITENSVPEKSITDNSVTSVLPIRGPVISSRIQGCHSISGISDLERRGVPQACAGDIRRVEVGGHVKVNVKVVVKILQDVGRQGNFKLDVVDDDSCGQDRINWQEQRLA